MSNIPSLELLRRADDDDDDVEDCEIDPDAVAVLVVCIVLAVALVCVGFYLWKRNKAKQQHRALKWSDFMPLNFGSNNNQQDQMDDKTSAFGSANEKSDWPQQFAGRGAWEGPQTASWTGAPSAIPFNQVSDYGQQQPQACWGSYYGTGSGYGSQPGSAFHGPPASGYGSNQQVYGGSGYGGYVEGSGFSASLGGSRSKSKRSRRPEYDDDDASIASYSAYGESPKRSGSSRSKRKGSTRKHSY